MGLSEGGTPCHDQRSVFGAPSVAISDARIGSPYCLRRDSTALRNLRDYSGVSSSRLEVLEDRLKSDVLNEIKAFQGRYVPFGGASSATNGLAVCFYTLRLLMDMLHRCGKASMMMRYHPCAKSWRKSRLPPQTSMSPLLDFR